MDPIEDVPMMDRQDKKEVSIDEGALEEEGSFSQVHSYDALLGEIDQSHQDNDSLHSQLQQFKHTNEDRLRYRAYEDRYRKERDIVQAMVQSLY